MKGYYLMPHPPVMIPEVGRGREKEIQNTVNACKIVGKEIGNLSIDTIIVITPHGTVFRDAVALIDTDNLKGDLSKFGARNIKFKFEIDSNLTAAILKESRKLGVNAIDLNEGNSNLYGIELELDHGVMVPLYYIKDVEKYNLVHISYGMLTPMELYSFGMAINNACLQLKSKVALIASGDLSHRLSESSPYSYSEYGQKFDVELMDILKVGNFKRLLNMDACTVREAGECGLRSLYILAGALDEKEVKGEILSYEGTLGVGYGVVKFEVKEGKSIFNDIKASIKAEHLRRVSEGNSYTKLARKNIENYFKTKKSLSMDEIESEELLNERKGVFVSLKIDGELRGCVGSIEDVSNSVGEEILRNSLSAAFKDSRFSPLREEELYISDISVDVIYPAEKCEISDLNPSKYGVIVTYGKKRGILLPNLDGVDTIEEQISIALQKAEIVESEPYVIERFKIERFSEYNF